MFGKSYERENFRQHKSEKLLDAFLFHAEKREAQKLQKELEFLKKRNEFISHIKKRKIEDGQKASPADQKLPTEISKNEDKKSENLPNSQKEEIKKAEQPQPQKCIFCPILKKIKVDPYVALIKILKFIISSKEYSKCLKMLDKLLKNCIGDLDITSVFCTLDLLCWNPHKFKDKFDRTLLREIFTFVLEYAENNSPYFSSEQELLIEYYQIPAILHVQLFTDDSFQVFFHF